MKKQLLKRHDIIRIEDGLTINIPIQKKFLDNKTIFSDELVTDYVKVGKIYKFPTANHLTLENILKHMEISLNDILKTYSLDPSSYQKQISSFLQSLNLKIEEDTYDTSIFRGEYKVYFVESSLYNYIVYCEKLDNSGIEIKFDLYADDNENYYTLLSH